MKFSTQLFSSTNESLKDETLLLLLWVGSLVSDTVHFCVYPYNICGDANAEEQSRVSESRLNSELYIYIVLNTIQCTMCLRLLNIFIYMIYIYIYIYIPSCYGSIPFILELIGRDGSLSTKTFPGPGYLPSEDGIVWLWHFTVNLWI